MDEPGEDGENDASAGEDSGDSENDAPANEPDGPDNEDDAPVDEDSGDGEDDAPADEPGEPNENDAPVDEDSGDGGETVPASINSAPSNDEPQTTADGVINVKLVDDNGYVTAVRDSNYYYRKDHGDPLPGSYVLNQGDKLHLEAGVCALDVAGGHVTRKDYRLDQATGELLSVTYLVEPDGTGDMTVTTRPDDQAPKPIKIEYAGAVEKIDTSGNVYVLPGDGFYADPGDGFTISVEGGAFVSGSYFVRVNEDATSVKVIVTAIQNNATLKLTGIPGAAETTDRDDLNARPGRTYVASGGTMADGKGCFLLKSGYAVGSGVTGGSVWLWSVEYDKATGDIYSCYMVDAAAETVTVPIVEARPYRWVDVKVDNDVGGDCNVGNVLPVVGTTHSSGDNGDWEDRFLVLDELIATIDSGYELVAVSGCTLRWVKDEYGNITYRIFPDGTGDTTIQLRVIDAGQQEPVLKVVTDADGGVQTDTAAESLKTAVGGAMDTLTKGGVPAGMSADMAEALRAALEAVDAFTAPEVTAVLNVKQGDATAVSGADAVYEIGIVLRVNGTEVGSLTELAQPISIGLPVPQQLSGRIVYLVRSHDGTRERLASTVRDGAIYFATDRFSDFAIMSDSDLAHAAVDPIPDQTWTGAELTPKVRVTITGPRGQETLKEGADYRLVYKDNVKAGTATVTVVGMGDFADTSMTVNFRIVEAKGEAAPGTAPATGDETPLALFTGLPVLWASGLAAVLLRRKKRQ